MKGTPHFRVFRDWKKVAHLYAQTPDAEVPVVVFASGPIDTWPAGTRDPIPYQRGFYVGVYNVLATRTGLEALDRMPELNTIMECLPSDQ